MSHRNLVILTKIILFYSLFYILIRVISIFDHDLLVPYLMLIFPFLILAVMSGWQIMKKKFSWLFVLIGAAIIILIRIYEKELVWNMMRW